MNAEIKNIFPQLLSNFRSWHHPTPLNIKAFGGRSGLQIPNKRHFHASIGTPGANHFSQKISSHLLTVILTVILIKALQ